MMKRRLALALLAAVCLAACGALTRPAAQEPSRTLTVFAAASLTDAFSEIGAQFEADHPGVTVVFNFAGSQALRTQLEQGALADVFASANLNEMETLIQAELVARDAVRIFLTNRLVVILPPANPAGIGSLADLARPGIKLVLAAEEVPAGRYARQALESLESLFGPGYMQAVLLNVVSSEDNVRLVVTKVELGEADAGIVYVSDAVGAGGLLSLPIPDEFNVSATYPLAALSGAPEPGLAAEFTAAVLSAQGQSSLQAWGFTPVQP
jgi:molybdate transport system substrate-binding protein